MKSWRDIAIPNPDVLKGTVQQSEFAADLTAVHRGAAPAIYQDPAAFFRCTYITEGMRHLLRQVAERLSGQGGEPVIQLQTAFGGGKTHTMLAVLHLAQRECPLSDLADIPELIEQAGLMDVPRARVAVIDGTALAPNTPRTHGDRHVATLWGELAWQLGGEDAFARVRDADASGTSPGKDILREVIEAAAPCVILIDELVAYIRQFEGDRVLSGGTYNSNLSFIQSLTEAVKAVPNAVLLASLPESDIEAGNAHGVRALKAMEKTFGRVQALWKPVATEEAFEIVRRRLFEPITDGAGRDAVCRAFADAYIAEGDRLPGETQESRYFERLCRAYPIHPEVFDRLYEDWTTIEGFQRTRGVLKLMAKVIGRLWREHNRDLLIMPGTLPLANGEVRNELTYYLAQGWDPVIDSDVDGDRSQPMNLEEQEPRFGQISAARRVTRTIFLATAPSSGALHRGARGIDRGRMLLGCLQPGEAAAVYGDALNRLADRLHYLNASGEKAALTTRFWFDTRANLRREMEERRRRFDRKTDVRPRIEKVVRQTFPGGRIFDGVHVFTRHSDVPDDSALRLVILPPEEWYSRESPAHAQDAVRTFLRSHGEQPRHRANRLLFVAADHPVLTRLFDMTQVALAWESIVKDVNEGKLNIDQHQRKQAEAEAKAAADSLPRIARECFRWLLNPAQDDPAAAAPTIEPFAIATSGSSATAEIERICTDNELVITMWSPIHLRTLANQFYWKRSPDFPWRTFWEDSQRYLYLPRLRQEDVLLSAVRLGAATTEFFGIAEGAKDGEYEGFHLGGGSAAVTNSTLLIEPGVAKVHALKLQSITTGAPVVGSMSIGTSAGPPTQSPTTGAQHPGAEPGTTTAGTPDQQRPRNFRGTADIPATLAKSRLNQIAEEILSHLASDPTAEVRITLEIDATFPSGASDTIRRTVSENATSLGLRVREWE